MVFELVERDAAGRIGKWYVGGKKVKTPLLLPVINPNIPVVSSNELRKMGCEMVITNAFIIKSSFADKAVERGVRKITGWNGPVYTDSGTFQMFSRGVKDLSSREMVEYQVKIGSDVVTPVDMFTLPDETKREANVKLNETIKRTREARELVDFLCVPIQGGCFTDLRACACKAASEIGGEVYAIGGIVPLMENYRFTELSDIVLTCTSNLPSNRPVHAFGCGHPMVFSLLVAFGCDVFDSAMYSLAACKGRYLTPTGTRNLSELREFPCFCPVCSRHTPEEILKMGEKERIKKLSLHNLYISFQEIKEIRQAVYEGRLWELVQERVRSHPRLLEALIFSLKKYRSFFLSRDPVSKKSAFFYSGKESELRPEVLRAKEWVKRVRSKKYFVKKPFGRIPVELWGVYPFFQSIVPGFTEEKQPKVSEKSVVKAIMDYQFGDGAGKLLKTFEVEKSKKTGKIRRIISKGKVLGTIRAYDNFFLPTVHGAELLKEKMKKIVVRDEAVEFVKKGRDVLAKFAETDDKVFPGEEVVVEDREGNIIAVGKCMLNRKEISEFDKGVAVKVRNSVKYLSS
ncbi:MAG: tRNA guanosine(15) transglycosylase TgtA [Candidatus Micrarchaeota archaeon]|nr:tRNA guanosine(15) transglycosylase TgtA [Candidatus Micrarchaeota archaeon]